jgi:hypothetical protein
MNFYFHAIYKMGPDLADGGQVLLLNLRELVEANDGSIFHLHGTLMEIAWFEVLEKFLVSGRRTTDLGHNAVEDVVHVRDLHATLLHLLGIDHERYSVQYQGLDAVIQI